MVARSYLSPSDITRIKSELKDIRARRGAKDDIPEGDGTYYRPREFPIDDGPLMEREAKLKGILEKDSPPHVHPMQKNSAYREFRDLVVEFESNSLTKYEQGLGYPSIMAKMGPDAELSFGRSKEKIMKWEMGSRGSVVCNRLKELAGVIDPENPQLRNLENFRRRK